MTLLFLVGALFASTPVWAAIVPQGGIHHSTSFDYVIVGGGTAGLTLANRLSENPFVTVAVVEAGTHIEQVAGNISEVPAYDARGEALAVANTNVGWGFQTTPQPVRYHRRVPTWHR